MRHRAQFQRQAPASDGYGNTVDRWGDLVTVWSNLRETTGKERVAAGALEADRTATLRIRNSPVTRAIMSADRVRVRNNTWRILGIANADDKGAFLDLALRIDPTAEVI